ncbi:hypothetical protein F5X96DRAFT_651193 [Biscogniauxia mediterranea]|nr:hypothetical protein F5X96DRAFT_651193 [Biscogniauxia mediterranea]
MNSGAYHQYGWVFFIIIIQELDWIGLGVVWVFIIKKHFLISIISLFPPQSSGIAARAASGYGGVGFFSLFAYFGNHNVALHLPIYPY